MLVTAKAVPPTDATCVGDTALIDAAPPKNMIGCKDCCTLMFEVARVLGSCEVNIRHTNPVPTLIWLDSEKKISVAADKPFTMDNSDDEIKLNSALESVWQPGSWHCN